MFRRWLPAGLIAALGLAVWTGSAAPARAQSFTVSRYPPPQDYTVNRFWYYPYYYFPANYWPGMSCKWPEPPGQPYVRPPAYMAFPPFREPAWRYEYWEPQPYHRGMHFMLDVF